MNANQKKATQSGRHGAKEKFVWTFTLGTNKKRNLESAYLMEKKKNGTFIRQNEGMKGRGGNHRARNLPSKGGCEGKTIRSVRTPGGQYQDWIRSKVIGD